MKVYNILLVLSEIRQIVVESVHKISYYEVSSDIQDIQFKLPTATVRVVHTDLGETDLKELGEIDQDSSEDGGEEIREESTGSGLTLSVMVGPADGQESLNTNC